MLDDSAPGCPWCSATLGPGATVCPSCGANLAADDASEIPGVTEIDKAAVGIARPPAIRSRSRWRSWISGEPAGDSLTQSEAKAIAPPDDAVRTEMLRLELAARVARLQGEADALLSEAAEEGRTIDLPAEVRPYAPGAQPAPDEAADVVETADQPASEGDPVA